MAFKTPFADFTIPLEWVEGTSPVIYDPFRQMGHLMPFGDVSNANAGYTKSVVLFPALDQLMDSSLQREYFSATHGKEQPAKRSARYYIN